LLNAFTIVLLPLDSALRGALAVGVLALLPGLVLAVCPPSCAVTGGGPPDLDCHAEFAGSALRLNYPPHDPARPEPRTEMRCFDGDAGCDSDGTVDDACVFDIDVCLRNEDPALPECAPVDVIEVTVAGAEGAPDLAALQAALNDLLPATANVCTSGQTLRVPLAGAPSVLQTVQLSVRTAGGATANDRLDLRCVRREWPYHGYDHANRRHNPLETAIGPANAASLRRKWQLDVGDPAGQRAGGVTATPTVGNGFVYVPSWSGSVHAVDPESGEVAWTYAAGATIGLNSATLTADERLLVGSQTTVHCVNAVTGERLWTRDLRAKAQDLIWTAPQVANGRVFVGIAAVSDSPCTPGRLVALDLDTGEVLWSLRTVPEHVCQLDTGIQCDGESDCPGGPCVEGCGGAITATVAIGPSGEFVYMNTVGSFTYPSIGDSDSIFKIAAATGEVVWKKRVTPFEQFGACRNDPSIDCGTDADCDGGECARKSVYHDFGFVNGPVLAEVPDGGGGRRALVVSAGKNGTLYALDEATGEIVWTNEVLPTPVTPGFGAYGLFTGAIGFNGESFHATLDATVLRPPPPAQPEHLMAFRAADGAALWSDEIGRSWSNVGLANGLVFSGTNAQRMGCAIDGSPCSAETGCVTGACINGSSFFVHDASDGTRLNEFFLPATSASGAAIAGGTVYVGYGIFGTVGGVLALSVPSCLGDCDGDLTVRVNELTTGIGIASGSTPLDACPAFDGDESGTVTIDELVAGVDNGLFGCER
jgi:outer membrane protein assembly factor BamB